MPPERVDGTRTYKAIGKARRLKKKGDKKDDKKKGNKKKGSKLRRQAKRDVSTAFSPLFNELERAKQTGEDEYQESDTRVKNIYDALNAELGRVNYGGGQNIAGNLNESLGSLASLLGGTGSLGAGEQGAGLGMFGGIGAGAQATLAGNQQRNANYDASTQRQSGIERADLRRNYLEDFMDLKDDIKQQRLDLKGDMGAQIMTRIDELRQSKKEFGLAEKELQIRKDIADDQIGVQKKGLRQQNKQRRSENRQANKQQNFVEDQITDTQQRNQVGRRLKRVNKKLGNVNQNLNYYEGLPPDPFTSAKVNKLENKQGRLQKRKKRLRRKKRSL